MNTLAADNQVNVLSVQNSTIQTRTKESNYVVWQKGKRGSGLTIQHGLKKFR